VFDINVDPKGFQNFIQTFSEGAVEIKATLLYPDLEQIVDYCDRRKANLVIDSSGIHENQTLPKIGEFSRLPAV